MMKKLKMTSLLVVCLGLSYSVTAMADIGTDNSLASAPVSLQPITDSLQQIPVPTKSATQAQSNATPTSDSSAAQANGPTSTAGQSKQAFQQLLNTSFPLSPDQIHEFKNTAATQQEANAMPPGDAPANGTSAIIPVTVKPGGLMPIIRIGQGMITSLVFIDASGQVWPITSFSIGDAKSFNVQWDKKSGVLMVQGEALYAQSNIGVMLQGMQIPVMLNLVVGQKQWDYLDYIRMDQNQDGSTGLPQPAQAPGYLIDLLNGLPPVGAVELNTSDSNVQLWSFESNYLLLTHASLLSPGFISRADGPGTTPLHAYELPVAPYILISNQGNIERVQVVESNNAAS
ncbi:MAG: DotH/IcmK family type IV secretion protein [Gammaproteobacteria bacterium]|nr:DotH/IcmK family type IV secretion protein [Gammaproteobacteria bacterium]